MRTSTNRSGVHEFRKRIAQKVAKLTADGCLALAKDHQLRRQWLTGNFGTYSAGTDDFLKRRLLFILRRTGRI